MGRIMTAVRSALEGEGWLCREVERADVLEMEFEAHHTRVPLHLQVFEPVSALHVVSRASLDFPPSHLGSLGELLLRATGDLTVGNFELDWSTRTPLFRVANLFSPSASPDPRVIAGMVQAAVTEMDRMTPLLASLRAVPADGLAAFPVASLLAREDWLPPVPDGEGTP